MVQGGRQMGKRKGRAAEGAGRNTEALPSFLSSAAPSRPSREDCGGGQRREHSGPALQKLPGKEHVLHLEAL